MKSIFMQAMQRAIETANVNIQHATYRMAKPLKEHDDTTLGDYYFYVERKVSTVVHPYIREVFGEWMNFLEVSREPDINKLLPSRGTDPLGSRIGIEALLSLIYDRSVINDRGVLRGVLNILAGLGYVPFGVVIAGRDDHLEVGITLCGKNDAYRIDLTVNTQ